MKKLLLALSLSIFLLSSCKKDSTLAPQAKTPLSFSVTTFDIATRPFPKIGGVSATGDTLKNHIKFLECVVFDANENFVSRITQSENNPDFGAMSLALAPGNYTIVFAGRGIQYATRFAYGSAQTLSNLILLANGDTDDVFLKTISLSVAQTPIIQAVRLPRIVGAIEVTLQDPIPADADRVTLHIGFEGHYAVKTGTMYSTFPNTKFFHIPVAERGKPNTKYFMYMLNTKSPLRIEVECQSGGVTYRKVASNVPVYPNEVTRLTCKLF